MADSLLTLHQLLERLDYQADETLTINYQRPGQHFITRTTTPAAATIDGLNDADVWYSINPTCPTTGRGKAQDVTRLAALWADLDVKPGGCPDMDTANAIVEVLSTMLGTDPVAIVYSGHGIQPLWAIETHPLATPDDTAAAKALLRRWGRLVAHVADQHNAKVDSVFDLPRILRAPGSTNHKNKNKPASVLCLPGNGYPLATNDIDEQLTAYGVTEQPGDRDDLGTQVTNPDTWKHANNTCGYAAKTIKGWMADTPTARHPWLMSCAVRLAAMHAHGCLTNTDHQSATKALTERFRYTLATSTPTRQPGPGEIPEALSWGVARAAAMDPDRIHSELGNHPHLTAAPTDPTDPFGTSTPPTGTSTPPTGTNSPQPAAHTNPRPLDVTRVGEHYGPTEDGTAQALVHLHDGTLRYCPQRGDWLTWTGARWEWDTREQHRELIRQIARDLPGGEGWATHKRRALSAAGVTGIARLAQSDPRITIHIDRLDSNPYEINTPGGIIDLRTGTIRPPDPTALHTRTTTATPDFNHPSTLLASFLTTTFGGDRQLIGYVQRLLGVAIIGTVLEQILPFAHGSGANGKSTLFEAAIHALGRGEDGYAMSVPSEMLMVRKHTEHPAELAQLAGARLAVASELEDGARFAEARIKQLTGRDSINARFMRRDPFTFTPSHTFVLLGNHKPQATTGGPAFWRRLALIPFDHVVPEPERDPLLGEKLAEQDGAILAWMAAGAADYLTHGLRPPTAIQDATAQYALEQDTVGRFVDERCTIGAAQRSAMREFRAAYESWCLESGETPVTARRLGQEIRDRFGVTAARSTGMKYYRGIDVTPESDPESDPYDEPGPRW